MFFQTFIWFPMCQKVVLLIAQRGSVWSEATLTQGERTYLPKIMQNTLDLCWKRHIEDTDLFSLMSPARLTCDPKWKCHHKHKILWLKLRHSSLSYIPERSIAASGWTWRRKWVPKLSRYCGRACGLLSLEAGMWTPIRAHSPTASTSTFGFFSWPSPSCCIW